MTLMDWLGVKLGFGFSAGLFDYVLGYGISTKPLLLIPVGLIYSAVYYGTFRYCILRFNLKTPGRDIEAAESTSSAPTGDRSQGFIEALGGAANIRTVDACMTRLRLELADAARVSEPRLKTLGARGVVRPGGNAFQVVLGPIADQVAGEIRAGLAGGRGAAAASAEQLLKALGGAANLKAVAARSTRLIVDLVDAAAISPGVIEAAGVRAWTSVGDGRFHLIVGPEAAKRADELTLLTRSH
jgi:PTS system N-acetylglucosamine-specific IIC component